MRTFHIFKINPYLSNLIKDDEYVLFHSLLKIKNLKKRDLSIGIDLYEQIAVPFDINKLNKEIYKYYRECDYYSVFQNKHSYIDKYKDEESYMNIKPTYLKVISNMSNPDFLKYLKKYKNLFVCDFDNKDYFFSNEI